MAVVRCVTCVKHAVQGLEHSKHICKGGNAFIPTELNARLAESLNEKVGDKEGYSSRKDIIRIFFLI